MDASVKNFLGEEVRYMDWKSASKNDQGLYKIPKRWLQIHYYEALNIKRSHVKENIKSYQEL